MPALQCPSNGVCGEESVFSNDTGKISLEDGIIPKNQMCFWELGPFNKAIYHIQLSLINQGFTQKTLDIPGYLWIVCCIATTTPNQPSCKIELLWIRNETVIKG